MSAENKYSREFNPSDTVEYSDGAVVSKTIIKKENGNLTLFSFDKGERLAEHTSPYDAFIHILDGKAEVILDKIIHNLSAGQSILLPANIPHSLRAVEKFKMMLIMIKS
ncbi:MAG: cupin domain-containing protein [Ignavibacteria bacterium]|nr:cupin domain-containing protein [Ignavibacteria bacterium]